MYGKTSASPAQPGDECPHLALGAGPSEIATSLVHKPAALWAPEEGHDPVEQ